MSNEVDEEGMTGTADAGADLTAEERDLIQQTRNAGMRPTELLDRAKRQAAAETADAQAKAKAAADAAAKQPITPEAVARQADYAANMALAQRDLRVAVRDVVESFEAMKGDPVELAQVEAQAAADVRKRADYATLNTPEKMIEAVAEAAKAECQRRMGKKHATQAAESRKKAEDRLDKQSDAVESGKATARSAEPSLGSVGLDTIDERIFGTRANWPADENDFVNRCKADDLSFIEKRMGRKK